MAQSQPLFEDIPIRDETWVSMFLRLNRLQVAVLSIRASDAHLLGAFAGRS